MTQVMKRACKGRRKDGLPCGMAPLEGEELCFNHAPSQSAARARARTLGGHRRRRPKATALNPEPVRLRSPADVIALLEGVMCDTLHLENGASRSRAIGYLAGLALKALEIGEIEERLTALERLIAERKALQKLA